MRRNDFNTVVDRVATLLEKYPNLRNCDKKLIATYMHVYEHHTTFKDWALDPTSISTRSIGRARRKLTNAGKYLPTDPSVQRARRLNQREVKKSLGYFVGR